MSALKYYLWLSSLEDVSPKTALRLIDSFGSPEAVYYASEAQIKSVPGLKRNEINALGNKNLSRVDRILADCDRNKISIMPICDSIYPSRLKNIADPPIVLYCRGKILDLDDHMAVGFVGPRKPSAHGAITAEKLTREFSLCGGLVVSGFAGGIDAAAHRGAMDADCPSVAVFANGIDICYPCGNRDLYDRICSSGMILSEYPPGTRPDGFRFPVRNRIISGISLGVTVIEAPIRSGSLITARWALEQGRDIFAVPGNIDTPYSEGSNNLIKDGAKPITKAADIIEEYAAQYVHRIEQARDELKRGIAHPRPSIAGWFRPKQKRAAEVKSVRTADASAASEAAQAVEQPQPSAPSPLPEDLTDEQRKIAQIFSDGQRLHIDTIIEKSGLAPASALSILTMLEIKAVVRQLPGKYFERI